MFARFFIVIGVVVGLLGSAQADGKAQARPFVESGDRDYKLGKFEDALVEYTRAYELFPAPAILFNLGQCHRNLKNYERAVFFYEGYLRDRPDAPNRPLVEDLIRESRAALDKQAAEAAAARKAADDDARRTRDEALRQREEDRRLAAARHIEPPPPVVVVHHADAPIYKRWWFWTAVGAVAATAGGTAYYFSGTTTTVLPAGSLGSLDRR